MNYAPVQRYVESGSGDYIPEPKQYILIRDIYSYVKYDPLAHADAITRYIYDTVSGSYAPYEGTLFVLDEGSGTYVLYDAFVHGDATRYLYDEYNDRYVAYTDPVNYLYDEENYMIVPNDGASSVQTVKRYVYDAEEKMFVAYDPNGTYPEDILIYRRNTLIEEISFANNCTITEFGDNAFAGMTNLQKITIPKSIKHISANAFSDCVNLREIVFEAGITDLVIDEGAFRNCVRLETVRIPAGVTGLADGAFTLCTSLREIYLESLRPIVLYNNAMPFEIVEGMKIYIPYGTAANYRSNWSAYDEYIVELPKAE